VHCIIIYIIYLDILIIRKINRFSASRKKADNELEESLNIIDKIYIVLKAFLFIISNMMFIFMATIISIPTILNGIAWIFLYNCKCKSIDDDGWQECHCN
jgi:hypothetical protein